MYTRLLDLSKHVKVWISFAKFEEQHSQHFDKARSIYQNAYIHFKDNQPELKEERLMILENWLQMESGEGLGGIDSHGAKHVRSKLPKRVKKRRQTQGASAGWEEYYDLIFPDDQGSAKNIKILELAHKWKKTEEVN